MLTAARTLFAISGLFWIAIGVLTPIVMDRWTAPSGLFVSYETDKELYGAPPEEILRDNTSVKLLQGMTLRAIAGLMVAAGLGVAGLAWFGLRDNEAWALGLLTAIGLAVLPYWWITLAPYRVAGIRLGLGDIPPFMWLPAILMPLASIIGWMSQRGQA